MKKNTQSESANLRQQAEELLSKGLKKSIEQLSEAEIYKLIHELEVHQIELELQNDELILAKKETTIASEKYIELYDFAPSGYFTLTDKGEILQLNLIGAEILGKDRSQLNNRLFHLFVTVDSKSIFWLFLKKVFSSNVQESCELALPVNGNKTLYVYLTGIVAENGNHCFVTATDITERKRVAEALHENEEYFRSTFEQAAVGIAQVAPDGRFLRFNQRLCYIVGYTRRSC